MGLLRFAYAILSLNRLAQRASNSDTRQRCEEIFFDLLYDSCIYFTIYLRTHVKVRARPIPANRGEVSRENVAARGEFF